MGLNFKKIEPVQFGDIVATPKVDEETKLRLQKIDLSTVQGWDDGIDLMAGCFAEQKEEIKDFMKTNMTSLDLNKLQAYLMGGDAMVELLEKRMEKFFEKEVENE